MLHYDYMCNILFSVDFELANLDFQDTQVVYGQPAQ